MTALPLPGPRAFVVSSTMTPIPITTCTTWGGERFLPACVLAQVFGGRRLQFGSLDFGHGQSRSGIQMIQAFASYALGPHMISDGWVGPEYTATKNKVPIFCTPYGCFIEMFHNARGTSPSEGILAGTDSAMASPVAFRQVDFRRWHRLGIVRVYRLRAITSGN